MKSTTRVAIGTYAKLANKTFNEVAEQMKTDKAMEENIVHLSKIYESNIKTRIADFIEDYNSLLDGFDDELAGIDDIGGSTKKIKNLEQVLMADLECDEMLFNEYHEIKELLKK